MKSTIITALLSVWLLTPAATVAANAPPSRQETTFSARTAPLDATRQVQQSETARDYAAREAAARQLEQWSGGHEGAGIYIGGSALAVALIIVLLVVLL